MTTAAPEPRANQGQPSPRVDARLKVTGEARYAADFPVDRLAYGALVTSAIAAGAVDEVRSDLARKVPGFLDVVTYGDMEKIKKPKFSNTSGTSIGPLHDRTIYHDGQIIALVVADTFEAATEAAFLIEARYRPKSAASGFGQAGTTTEDAVGKSAQFKEDPSVGDFKAAYETATVKLDLAYSTPTQHHNPIELFSTTAVWQGGMLTVYEPSQNVHGWQIEIARQMDLEPDQVRVISPYVGGAFGSKGPMSPRTAIVAEAARRIGRPVRCVVTRDQGFTTMTYRAETRHHIQIGAGPNGRITAYSHEGWEVSSRPDPYVVGGTETTTRMYGYGAVASKVRIVHADRPTPGYMRSPPEVPYVFALESAMDELAERLKMDPVELRRVNDTMNEPIKGYPFTTRALMRCYDEGAKAFRWSERKPEPRSMRDGDWLVGLGCATSIYPTNIGASTARIRLNASGRVLVQTATHEIGTGVRTIASQMAAERLGLSLEAVSIEVGDSSLPPAPVAGGSNSTASVCSTIIKACDQVRARLFKAAGESGPLAGQPAEGLDLKDGRIVGPGGASISLAELFQSAGLGTVEEYAEFIPEGAPADSIKKLYEGETTMVGGSKGTMMKFSFGAEFVEVRINARTREIRVPRLVGAFTAGRIMNTRTAHSQLMGGLIWGMSAALLEATEIDRRNARVVNRDLADYLVPVNADVGEVTAILLSEEDTKVNPAGVKGLGELGNVGTNAAIANAVYHATGKRIRDLPIRLEALLDV